MSQQTTVSTTTINEDDNKPIKGSWRSQIQTNKCFVIMVDEILKVTCPNGASESTKSQVMDYCETLWKFAIADRLAKDSKNTHGEKPAEIEVLVSESNDNSINSIPDPESEPEPKKEEVKKEKKERNTKTTKKSCAC